MLKKLVNFFKKSEAPSQSLGLSSVASSPGNSNNNRTVNSNVSQTMFTGGNSALRLPTPGYRGNLMVHAPAFIILACAERGLTNPTDISPLHEFGKYLSEVGEEYALVVFIASISAGAGYLCYLSYMNGKTSIVRADQLIEAGIKLPIALFPMLFTVKLLNDAILINHGSADNSASNDDNNITDAERIALYTSTAVLGTGTFKFWSETYGNILNKFSACQDIKFKSVAFAAWREALIFGNAAACYYTVASLNGDQYDTDDVGNPQASFAIDILSKTTAAVVGGLVAEIVYDSAGSVLDNLCCSEWLKNCMKGRSAEEEEARQRLNATRSTIQYGSSNSNV